jgi:hypothetical protein
MRRFLTKTSLALVANAPLLGLLPAVSPQDFANLQQARAIWDRQRRQEKGLA